MMPPLSDEIETDNVDVESPFSTNKSLNDELIEIVCLKPEIIQ